MTIVSPAELAAEIYKSKLYTDDVFSELTVSSLVGGTVRYRNDLSAITNKNLVIITTAYSSSHPFITGYWVWQSATPPSWDISAVSGHPSIGGYWVQIFPAGFVSPEHFGAKGDYDLTNYVSTTYDNDAIVAAMQAAVTYNLPLVMRRPYAIEHQSVQPTKAIRIPNNLVWRFTGKGCVVHDGELQHPWFWAEATALNLTVENGRFFFAGIIDRNTRPLTKFQTTYDYWFNTELQRPTNTACNDTNTLGDPWCPLFLCAGTGSNVLLRGCEFRTIGSSTLDNTNNNLTMLTAISLNTANDSSKASYVKIDGATFDAVQMGIVAIGYDTLELVNSESIRYSAMNTLAGGTGSPNPGWTALPPPGHFLYSSHSAARNGSGEVYSNTTILRNCYDYGIDLSEVNNGQNAFKFKASSKVYADNCVSLRPHGAFDIAGVDVAVKHGYFEASAYKCKAGGVAAVRLLSDMGTIGGTVQLTGKITDGTHALLPTSNYIDFGAAASNLKVDLDLTLDGFKARGLFSLPSIASGGSGGSSGTRIFQSATGTGTPFKFNATVSGGAITSIDSIVDYGNFTTDPTTSGGAVTDITGSGNNVTGATVNCTMGTSNLFNITNHTNNKYNIKINVNNAVSYASPNICSFNTAASGNKFYVEIANVPFTGIRFIHNTKSSMSGNKYSVVDVVGQSRNIADGLEYQELIKEAVLTASGASSLTASSFIPAGVEVLSLTAIITTALSGGGVTGFQLGDGNTANLWGSVTATAIGNGVAAANWHASTPTQAVQNVVVTFTGGSPTAGVVKVRLFYKLAKINTDTYYTG